MDALGNTGKPFFITEFGTNNGISPYVNPDVDTYERGFFLAEFVINSMNEGASLLSYWTLHDIWYQYGQLMQLGLWSYYDQQWRLRPSWYIWSLMSRFITMNSMVINTESNLSSLVDATAITTDGGRLTVIVANRDTQERVVRITVNDSKARDFKKYVYDKTTIENVNDELLPESGLLYDSIDTLQAQSITLYSEISISGVEEDLGSEKPTKTMIIRNFPNPFNPSTTIEYAISSDIGTGSDLSMLNVTLKVYDILGREVETLVNQQQQPGNYKVKFNASSLNSGIYFYRLQIGNFSDTKKMILMR